MWFLEILEFNFPHSRELISKQNIFTRQHSRTTLHFLWTLKCFFILFAPKVSLINLVTVFRQRDSHGAITSNGKSAPRRKVPTEERMRRSCQIQMGKVTMKVIILVAYTSDTLKWKAQLKCWDVWNALSSHFVTKLLGAFFDEVFAHRTFTLGIRQQMPSNVITSLRRYESILWRHFIVCQSSESEWNCSFELIHNMIWYGILFNLSIQNKQRNGFNL